MARKTEHILIDGLLISPEVAALDYDARRDQLTAEATGEAAMLVEPLESAVWAAVEPDPALEGERGARILMDSFKRLRPFFEEFADEQSAGTGPTAAELSERLRIAIKNEQATA